MGSRGVVRGVGLLGRRGIEGRWVGGLWLFWLASHCCSIVLMACTLMITKTCTKCGQSRDRAQHFRTGVAGTRDGFSTICKDCERRRQAQYYHKNRERILQSHRAPHGPYPYPDDRNKFSHFQRYWPG